jgi:membrane fusion protein, multidrug efflux system
MRNAETSSTPQLMRQLITGAVLALAAGALVGCAGAEGKSDVVVSTAIPVRLEAVVDGEGAQPVEATGTLASSDELQLSFKIGGVVARVLVQEGQAVRAGQPLAALDLREIDAQLAKARTALTKAQRDLARAQNLYKDSVATLENVQDATSAVEIAQSDYTTAAFNQRYAIILAPTNGVVLRKRATAGELVSSGQAVIVMGSAGSGSIVRVGITDRDAVRIRIGDPAVVKFSAYPDREFAGFVSEVPAAANPMTGTYPVEVRLNQAPEMATGLIGNVTIRPRASGSARLIPIEALVEADGNKAVVYTVDQDVAKRREISIAAIDDRHVAVTGGLDDASLVVTAGGVYLSEGAKVKVVR